MQQNQSLLIQENWTKIIIVYSKIKHKSKVMLGVIKGTMQNTLYIPWCLLNVNNICVLLRYA